MNLRTIFSNILIIISAFLLMIIFLKSSYIYNFVWPTERLFQDLIMPVKWLECNKAGIDIFKSDLCAGGTFAYGPIFLKIPITQALKIFYINYLPYLCIFLLITFIVTSINKNNLLSITLVLLSIFNPSTLLLFQRMNLDIVVILLIIFLTFNKIYFLNWFLVFFLTFTKVYPIVSGFIVFTENNKRSFKKIFTIILGMAILSILYLFFNLQNYINFFNGLSANKAGYHFLFSLNSIPKILKYTLNLNYILLLLVFYLSFFYSVNKLYKKLSLLNLSRIDFYSYNYKIFLLGALISLMSFILFSNYFHREVFLIITIPLIISLYYYSKSKFFKYFIFLIIIKYAYLFIYSYLNIYDGLSYENNERVFSNYFIITILIKSLIDFIYMAALASFTLLTIKKYLKSRN